MPHRIRRNIAAAAILLAAGFGAWSAAQAAIDPSFQAVNRTGRTILQLFVSPTSTDSWGADLLGREVLPHTWSLTVRPPQRECLNDVKWVLSDGRSFTRMQVDTCRLTALDLR
jgi:hypothetical protein